MKLISSRERNARLSCCARINSGLRLVGIDAANLIDEVETLGRSERRELWSRLETLLIHLLKWQYQPKRPGSSWSDTIWEQRGQLDDILNASPSLRRMLDAEVKNLYPRARHRATVQTPIAARHVPGRLSVVGNAGA